MRGRRIQRLGIAIGLGGLVLAILGFFLNNEQFWRSYLLAYLFWLEIGLGCLGLLMLHHLAGGRWSGMVRRLLETGAMTLPLLALLFLPLLAGLDTLYPWTDPDYVQESAALQRKTIYLNIPAFLIRAAIYFVIWIGLAYLLRRWSLAEDRTGDPRLAVRMRRLSAAGIILYVLAATFAAYDWMMSLEPEWFSSIYGLIFISGQGLAALAVAIIGLRILSANNDSASLDPASPDPASPDLATWTQSFNDLGNLLLGFVMIWAYFSFSQFLIIWTANMPEEAIWYYHRSRGGWQIMGMVLIGAHFVLPFLLLLSRRVKRTGRWLTWLAVLIFVTRIIDLYWQIVPAFYPDGVHLHWLDPVLLIGMGGVWIAVFLWQWAGKPALPRHDPRLPLEGVFDAQH